MVVPIAAAAGLSSRRHGSSRCKTPTRSTRGGNASNGRHCSSYPAVTAEELRNLLERRGLFPDHFRPIAWRILLELPGNVEAHHALIALGRHPALVDLSQVFPLHGKAGVRLSRALTALLHWAPVLADLPYLPALVFPVTQVFGAEEVMTFEFAATFFLCWGCDWLDFLPGPPLGALQRVAHLLEAADPKLFTHLVACSGCTCARFGVVVLWPLFQTLLSEVMPRADWLRLWDTLVARWREPALFEACLVVLLCRRRANLLALPKLQPHRLDEELRKTRTLRGPMRQVFVEAEALLCIPSTSQQLSELISMPAKPDPDVQTLPLPKGFTYPMLPNLCFSTDYSASELERLLNEYKMLHAEAPATRLRRSQILIAELENRIQEQGFSHDELVNRLQEKEFSHGAEERQATANRHVADVKPRLPAFRQQNNRLTGIQLGDAERQRRHELLTMTPQQSDTCFDEVMEDLEREGNEEYSDSVEEEIFVGTTRKELERDTSVVLVEDAMVVREPELGRLKMRLE